MQIPAAQIGGHKLSERLGGETQAFQIRHLAFRHRQQAGGPGLVQHRLHDEEGEEHRQPDQHGIRRRTLRGQGAAEQGQNDDDAGKGGDHHQQAGGEGEHGDQRGELN